MNILKYIRQMFCSHGLMDIRASETFVDDDLSKTVTTEYVCRECGKKRTIKTYHRSGERDSVSIEIFSDQN